MKAIEQRMAEAIINRARTRLLVGEAAAGESPYPQFIYLGQKEAQEFEAYFAAGRAFQVTEEDLRERYPVRHFMSTQVVTVCLPEHLEVSAS